MAVIHQATIHPTKDELVAPWLRTREWWDGFDERGPVGTFRLDDPADEVGIECFLFDSQGGSMLFVPLTYRGAELPGAESHLLGTMEHSVLGRRWIYDGCGDPVFASTVVETIRGAGHEAVLEVRRSDGSTEVREPSARAWGSGAPEIAALDPGSPVTAMDDHERTVIDAGTLTLTVARRVGRALPEGPCLNGTFAGGDDLVLATIG